MIARRLHDGLSIPHTPGADVAAGDVIVQGDLVGVAPHDIAANTLGSLQTRGVFSFPKATGAGTDAAAGTIFYWDESADQAVETDDAGANKPIGPSIAACTTADTHVEVLLTPSTRVTVEAP